MREEKEQKCFSKKYGYSNVGFQIGSIDEALKMDIWNLICAVIEATWISVDSSHNKTLNQDCVDLWCDFLKKNINWFPAPPFYISEIERIYHHKLEWFHIYDLIEYLNVKLEEHGHSEDFQRTINNVLESNASAYRLVNSRISPIIDQQTIDEIESTFSIVDKDNYTYKHLDKALNLYSDRGKPHYRISCDESFSAIETFLQEKLNNTDIFSKNKEKLEKAIPKYKMLWKALEQFYVIRNADTGHGENDKNPAFTQQDAIFIHRTACTWISYLDLHLSEELEEAILFQ